MRAAAIIKKDNQLLLVHRIKNSEEYFSFPGGKVEEGESPEEAVVREIKEEVSLVATEPELLFKLENDAYFLIENFTGEVALSGPEKKRSNAENLYMPEWHDLKNLPSNLVPAEARKKVEELLLT